MSSTRAELEARYAEAKNRYTEAYTETGDLKYKYASEHIQLRDDHLNTFYTHDSAGTLDNSLFKVIDGQVYTQFGMTDHIRSKIHDIPRGSEYQVSWLHIFEKDLPDIVLPLTADPDSPLIRITDVGKYTQARWTQMTRFRPARGPLSSDSEIEDVVEYEIGGDKYGRSLVSIDSVVIRTLDPGMSAKPTAGSIFGAAFYKSLAKEGETPLHCIDRILHNNKRKLLNLPVGVHKSVADIEPMIRRGKDVQLAIHNRLTHMLGLEPLFVVGLKGKKRIDIVNQFSHFTQCLLKNKDIEAVKYVKGIDPNSLGDAFNIVTKEGQYEPEILGYTALVDGKLTIVKTFQPADPSPAYYTCYNEASYQFKRFCFANNLRRCTQFTAEVAASIVYPPILKRAVFSKLGMIELDRNKAYPSSLAGNMFPTESFVCGGVDINNPCMAFVIVDKVISLTPLAKFYFATASLSVIPAPMYRYLVSVGCRFEASQALYSVMKSIVMDCPTTPKTLRNTVIGKLIQSHDTRKVVLPHVNKSEFESLAYTAAKNGLVHEPLYFGSNVIGSFLKSRAESEAGVGSDFGDDNSTIDMTIHCAPKPAYQHIYSFIMAYHNIAMLKKMAEFEFDSIKAVYVDAIFIDNSSGKAVDSSSAEGEFKLDKIKPYHYELPISKNVEWSAGEVVNISLPVTPILPKSQVTWITGPAGSGKSYPWLRLLEKAEQNYISILTPTCELRDSFKAKGCKDVHTAAKMFQFSMSDSAYASRAKMYYRPVYVVDEFTMFTREQFETMIRRQPNSFFIMLGDPCQICNSVNGRSILPLVDGSLGKSRAEISNAINWKEYATVRRQSGEFCEFLDSLRDMSVREQTEAVKSYFDWGVKSDCDIVIGGSWSRLSNVNDWFMEQADAGTDIPVKYTKPGGSSVRKVVKKSAGLHIRRTFAEPKQPLEVCFASTVDSYQGSTLSGKVGILVTDLDRPGALYTAVTRVVSRCQIVLLG